MPLRKSEEERTKIWIIKSANPDVIKARFDAIRDIQVRRMREYSRIGYMIDRIVCDTLDKYGISGVIRLNYYNFARKMWKELYTRESKVAERYFNAVCEYFKRSADLREDIMYEIADCIKKLVEQLKEERKKEAKMIEADSDGG